MYCVISVTAPCSADASAVYNHRCGSLVLCIHMPRSLFAPITPVSVAQALEYCHMIAESRGIALLMPGDLHLWGVNGGNRSDFFVRLLDELAYDAVVLVGDVFDSAKHERETHADREVLVRLRTLDEADRLHIVRGNHDQQVLDDPQSIRERARRELVIGEAGDPMDLSWLTRPRMHTNVVYAEADARVFVGPAHYDAEQHKDAWPTHTGTNDVLVLRVSDSHILYEHGDRYDRWARRAHASSIVKHVGTCAYDLLVRFERRRAEWGDATGSLKQRVSVWRGVCRDVAQGIHKRGVTLPIEVHASVSGHTHYPGYVQIDGVPQVNVGSFRGYRPSFALVTRDTGELLPPVVVRYGRE